MDESGAPQVTPEGICCDFCGDDRAGGCGAWHSTAAPTAWAPRSGSSYACPTCSKTRARTRPAGSCG